MTLEVPRPQSSAGVGGDAKPMHLLVDSTGLKLRGAGEWLVEKHRNRTRRSWRKLHLSVDADAGRIVAAPLTDHDVDDASKSVPCWTRWTARSPRSPARCVRPRKRLRRRRRAPSRGGRHRAPALDGVPSDTAETAPTQRDRHLQLIAEKGRMDGRRQRVTMPVPGSRPPWAGSKA